uniref:FAD-binding domain-containing protein n=1 Tax=Vannella robusta TaxID=1487602 RepID=A0A7S4HPS2_9EUKA|mmetsp:Transcript_13882/g.17461  ORF Transcript_13882/g.17461 Transcript_13882/m.17461 type:complete len:464 (+) Transcript_13882:57-1448(+)
MSWIVVGAGPAGIGAAISLAKRGYNVDVYERMADLDQSDEDSYPIGLNPRGMKALDCIDETGTLRESVTKETPIDAWNIYSGLKRVAMFPSGTTVGATRGGVTYCIFKEASTKYSDKIHFHFEYKLLAVDYSNKSLRFEVKQKEEITIDASNSRIIAADGVWSKLRIGFEKENPERFVSSKVPWECSFRLLFSTEDANTTLAPREHHIFSSGIYVAVVKSQLQKWVVAVQISENSPHRDMLKSDIPSKENIQALKEYVKENAPLAFDMIPDEEFKQFFTRRTFSGAVICTSKLNIGEWILFLGDSAHSVYPAIGEGINCALEDVQLFDQCFDKSELDSLFEYFHSIRYEDIQAVTEYAAHLVRTSNATARSAKISRVASTILRQVGKKLGLCGPIWNDKSFGAVATQVEPYHELLNTWKRQEVVIRPLAWMIGKSADIVIRVKFLLLLLLPVAIVAFYVILWR